MITAERSPSPEAQSAEHVRGKLPSGAGLGVPKANSIGCARRGTVLPETDELRDIKGDIVGVSKELDNLEPSRNYRLANVVYLNRSYQELGRQRLVIALRSQWCQ